MTECNGNPHLILVTINNREFCPHCDSEPKVENRYDDKAEATRNFYRKQGADAERERIIKLLETHSKTWDKSETLSCNACDFEGYDNEFDGHLIALIKGENK